MTEFDIKNLNFETKLKTILLNFCVFLVQTKLLFTLNELFIK